MSQLDIIEAKHALTRCLRSWIEDGLPVDQSYERAAGFIDDMVRRGWIMDPLKEGRPTAPHANEACLTCGKHLNACICGERRTRAVEASQPTSEYAQARVALKENR